MIPEESHYTIFFNIFFAPPPPTSLLCTCISLCYLALSFSLINSSFPFSCIFCLLSISGNSVRITCMMFRRAATQKPHPMLIMESSFVYVGDISTARQPSKSWFTQMWRASGHSRCCVPLCQKNRDATFADFIYSMPSWGQFQNSFLLFFDPMQLWFYHSFFFFFAALQNFTHLLFTHHPAVFPITLFPFRS